MLANMLFFFASLLQMPVITEPRGDFAQFGVSDGVWILLCLPRDAFSGRLPKMKRRPRFVSRGHDYYKDSITLALFE